MSFWEDWFKRWRSSPFFREMERAFREIDRAFEEAFGEFSKILPSDLFRERKLPDGSTVKTFGPIVFGYSMTIGPDGKPTVRTFGHPGITGIPKPIEKREPLVDVVPTPKYVKVIAELPGVDKSDIDLRAEEQKLTISVDTEERRYYKEVELPARVDPKSATATYTNGVLDVTLRRLEEERPGERVEIK